MRMPLRGLDKVFAGPIGALVGAIPWPEVASLLWRAGRRLCEGLAVAGMYEALAYASTLELLDAQGKRARFHKRERVRYLQHNIIAFQDQIWSDGRAPLRYRVAPGRVVDRYRPGQTTILLISLRGSRARGETDTYHIEWEIRDGFRRRQELWQTTIYYRTRRAQVRVIFPAARPPQQVWGTEQNRQRTHHLPDSARQQLPDGRWLVQWTLIRPRRNERYNLHWRW